MRPSGAQTGAIRGGIPSKTWSFRLNLSSTPADYASVQGVTPSQAPAHVGDRTLEAAMSKNAQQQSAARGAQNEGHGRRLTQAFEALEAFPALVESRNRLLRLAREERGSVGDMVAAVESDVALVIAVLRIANSAPSPKKGKITSIPKAIELLRPSGVEALASRTAVFDFFERTPGWDAQPERFRLHAVATQRAAERLAKEVGYEG